MYFTLGHFTFYYRGTLSCTLQKPSLAKVFVFWHLPRTYDYDTKLMHVSMYFKIDNCLTGTWIKCWSIGCWSHSRDYPARVKKVKDSLVGVRNGENLLIFTNHVYHQLSSGTVKTCCWSCIFDKKSLTLSSNLFAIQEIIHWRALHLFSEMNRLSKGTEDIGPRK